MSYKRKTHQGIDSHHPVSAPGSLASVAVKTSAIARSEALPSVSALLGSRFVHNRAPDSMNLESTITARNANFTANNAGAQRTNEPSQVPIPRNMAKMPVSETRNIPSSSNCCGSFANHDLNASQAPWLPSSNISIPRRHSPNVGPQPVGSSVEVGSNAPGMHNFHVATIQEGQMVIKMSNTSPQTADNGLVEWHPSKPSSEEASTLPFDSFLNAQHRQGSAHRQLEDTILGRRSPQSVEFKKDRSPEDTMLAASFDELARDYARASLSSRNTPSTAFVTRDKSHAERKSMNESYTAASLAKFQTQHSLHKTFQESNCVLSAQENVAGSQTQIPNTFEARYGLDFLASVILSQHSSENGKDQLSAPAHLAVASQNKNVAFVNVHPLAAPLYHSKVNKPEEHEPRSEASYLEQGTSPNADILPRMGSSKNAPMPIPSMADDSMKIMTSPAPNQVQVSVETVLPLKSFQDPNLSAPHVLGAKSSAIDGSNHGSTAVRGEEGYKLKRGPKPKKQSPRRQTKSTGSKGKKSQGKLHEKKFRIANPSHVQEMPFLSKQTASQDEHSASKGKHLTTKEKLSATKENADEVQHNLSLIQSSRSSHCLPTSAVSPPFNGISSLNGASSGYTESNQIHTQIDKKDTNGPEAEVRTEFATSRSIARQKASSSSQQDQRSPCALFLLQATRSESENESAKARHGALVMANQCTQEITNSSLATDSLTGPELQPTPNSIPSAGIAVAADDTPEYTHRCNQCSAVFNRRFNLNKHVRNVHQNIRKFGCNKCGEFFLQKSHLAAHMLAVHEKSRPFHCNLCPKRFSWIGVLRKHMQAIHKVTLQRKTIRKPRTRRSALSQGDVGETKLVGPSDALVSAMSSAQGSMVTLPVTDVPVAQRNLSCVENQPRSTPRENESIEMREAPC